MNRSGEFQALMAAVGGVCVLAALSSVVPVVEHLLGGALLLGAALWSVLAVLRRELRIRRRLTEPGTGRPSPGPGAGTPRPWAGPGDCTPVPYAPTAPSPSRADSGRPDRPTGGAR